MGWSERVRRDDVAAFEARARSDGLSSYRVSESSEAFSAPDAAVSALLRGDDVVAVRLVEPQQGNAAALGVNGLSFRHARERPSCARSTPASPRRRRAFA